LTLYADFTPNTKISLFVFVLDGSGSSHDPETIRQRSGKPDQFFSITEKPGLKKMFLAGKGIFNVSFIHDHK